MSNHTMHNAPVVYVPTEPEGNGLTLPMLLSLLAHGLVLGILIYAYQHTDVETAGSIETVMVSPEQLAEMQGQILANRAAAAEAMQTDSSTNGISSTLPPQTFDSGSTSQSTDQPNAQRAPVFTRSDDPASAPILMSETQHQRLLEQNQEYERRMAEWAAKLDEAVLEEHEAVEQDKKKQLIEEQRRLDEFHQKQNNPPKITRPTPTDRNLKIDTSGSGSAGKTFDLSEGQSTADSKPASTRSSASASADDFKNSIAAKIQRNLKAPLETQGITAKVALRLDNQGNVLSAKATGANSAVNDAAEKAAFAASPLPIDLTNPASFAALTINVMVQ
ncbi:MULTISPECIES: TonB C-terminal domain-containing protein [Psychrobacter]|uniref:TonB C-terminal domain-containing protein n=1 Tax=Psychrobacter TaxID=497 RepID=UPI001D0CF29F|nr:TonB C-terminal domain-containing protein [Psychrobacter sp. Marseille-P5312]